MGNKERRVKKTTKEKDTREAPQPETPIRPAPLGSQRSYPKAKNPEKCTLCGGSFEKDGKDCAFAYPPNHYLCFNCFTKSMDAGLGRLNKHLAMGNLDLSVEEIADIIKPQSSPTTARKEEC